MANIVTFGEIMLRLSPPGKERFFQSNHLETCFGGAEANTALLLAQLGTKASFVTRLPENPVGEGAMALLRSYGVDVTGIARGGERVGIYYLENGASVRPARCLYDRAHSAIAEARIDDFDWHTLLDGADLFHFTGITPALGGMLPEICLRACKEASARGIPVSFDPNYRAALWSKEAAARTLSAYLPYVDLLFSNPDQLNDLFFPNSSDPIAAANTLITRYHIDKVALTSRISHSASDNDISAHLITPRGVLSSRTLSLHIVDRIGAGDAFAAGMIDALLRGKGEEEALELALCASALKHTVPGDFGRFSRAELDALANSDGSARVIR